MTQSWTISPDRCFDAEPTQRGLARELYASVRDLPLVCPHGHVPPTLLADPNARLGSPADLFIIPDHYVVRMLYSQGVPMEDLGVPTVDGSSVETDHRKIWQRFAEHFYLFRGTPTGLWLTDTLINLFGIEEPLNGDSAQRIYDKLEQKIAQPEFAPRAMLKQFNIEVLCTTDSATDTLELHQQLHNDGMNFIRPTFRPDAVVNLDAAGWRSNIDDLSKVSGVDVVDYRSFIQALEQRRAFFKQMGALATDHAARTPRTARLEPSEADAIFQRALRGQSTAEDAERFTAHMLMEMARMSTEDGLVMQISRRQRAQPQPRCVRALRPRQRRGYPARYRVDAQFAAAAQRLRHRFALPPDSVHARREHLQPRTCSAGRTLSGAAAGRAMVVLRQRQRHAALP